MADKLIRKKTGRTSDEPKTTSTQRKKANQRTARALDTQKTVSRKQKQ